MDDSARLRQRHLQGQPFSPGFKGVDFLCGPRGKTDFLVAAYSAVIYAGLHVPKQTLAWQVWLLLHPAPQVNVQAAVPPKPRTSFSSWVVRFLTVSWLSVSLFRFFFIVRILLRFLKPGFRLAGCADYMLCSPGK